MRCSAALFVAACSAAPVSKDLALAESLERAGRREEAIAAYREAQRGCDPERCGEAYRGEASLVEDSGDAARAARLWQAMPERLPWDKQTSAAGLKNAAMLYLGLGEDARAYDLLWRTIATYPDEAAADDALRIVVADGRRRNPRQLLEALDRLYRGLARTGLGDNLLWEEAIVLHEDLHDEPRALATLDRLVAIYPQSPTLDEALWLAGQIARGLGDAAGALRRLRLLLATREPPNRIGSYISPYLPKSQMTIGLILRDDLRRPADAIPELRRVISNFPESIYLDDSLYEIAVAYDRLGDRAGVCRTLGELATQYPESKYELERAPELAARHRCGAKP
ncbi:MAG TPA: tetratricopeptide repeat protein [Haliangiales bacterium]|nr:tetratricopeptide repeat protein [Haliangiales bacterium]